MINLSFLFPMMGCNVRKIVWISSWGKHLTKSTENLRIFGISIKRGKFFYFCSHYLESRSINEKDYHSRRYIDEYRNDYNQVSESGHRHRDHESRYQNHSSKSSGRSGRSSYKSKHRIHHSTSHHRSHGV